MDSFCRLCQRTGEFESVSIYESSRIDGAILAVVIEDCLHITVTASDGLPQQICSLCQAQLEMFYLLRKVSINSDRYFKKLRNPGRLLSSPLNIEEEVDREQECDDLYGSMSEQLDESEIKTEPTELSEDLPSETSTFQNTYNTSTTPTSSNTTHSRQKRNQRPNVQPGLMYTCDYCDYGSTYKANVFRHMKLLKHYGLAGKNSESSIQEAEPEPPAIIRKKRRVRPSLKELLANRDSPMVTIYSCGTCIYKSAFKGNMDRHMRSQKHKGLKTSIYRKKKSIGEETSTQPINDQNDQATVQPSNHQPAIRPTSTVKIFSCEKCNYKSAFEGHIERHQRSQRHKGIRSNIYDKTKTIVVKSPIQTINDQVNAQYPMTPLYDAIQQYQIKQEEEDLMREMREEFIKIGASSSTDVLEGQQNPF